MNTKRMGLIAVFGLLLVAQLTLLVEYTKREVSTQNDDDPIEVNSQLNNTQAQAQAQAADTAEQKDRRLNDSSSAKFTVVLCNITNAVTFVCIIYGALKAEKDSRSLPFTVAGISELVSVVLCLISFNLMCSTAGCFEVDEPLYIFGVLSNFCLIAVVFASAGMCVAVTILYYLIMAVMYGLSCTVATPFYLLCCCSKTCSQFFTKYWYNPQDDTIFGKCMWVMPIAVWRWLFEKLRAFNFDLDSTGSADAEIPMSDPIGTVDKRALLGSYDAQIAEQISVAVVSAPVPPVAAQKVQSTPRGHRALNSCDYAKPTQRSELLGSGLQVDCGAANYQYQYQSMQTEYAALPTPHGLTGNTSNLSDM